MSGQWSAAARLLPDGRRLHLQQGPIDLIIEASGADAEVEAAYRQAIARFDGPLAELVDELPTLRQFRSDGDWRLRGRTARRMRAAVRPFLPAFVTPMAAVAGAVADEVLAALFAGRDLRRAYVNNGGDIALHLAPCAAFDVGVVSHPLRPRPCGKVVLTSEQPARGIATSGRHGRSLSRGIADAVTVIAATAAQADAAATMIANAVDLPGSAKVRRVPARDIDPDSDLATRQVTVDVAELAPREVAAALDHGARHAESLIESGVVTAAVLVLQDTLRVVEQARATVAAAHPRVLEGSLHA